jgi:hypothetical protein
VGRKFKIAERAIGFQREYKEKFLSEMDLPKKHPLSKRVAELEHQR